MRSLSRLLAALAAAFGCATTLAAAPLVLEERARLIPPDSRYTHVSEVAVDGNRAVISAWREGPQGTDSILAAFLFERNSAGTWVPASTLLLDQPGSYFGAPDPVAVAVQGNIAAIAWLGHLRIFERRSTGWVITADIQNPPGAEAIGRDVEIEGDNIIVTGQGPGIRVLAYRRNASGQWVQDGVMSAGNTSGILPFPHGEDADIAGNLLVFGVPLDPELADEPTIQVWAREANGWNPRLPLRLGDARALAFDGGTVLVAGYPEGGMLEVRGAGSNMFIDSVHPQSTDAFMLGRGNRNFATTFEWNSLAAASGLGVVGMFADDQRAEDAGSAHIYDITSAGGSRPLARLLASDASLQDFFGRRVEMSGRRVIVGATRAAYIYDLPADFSQPAVITDDFESGNATQWTPLAGSAFSVVPRGSGLVYRQSSVAGGAAAWRTNVDWTHQAIEADVRASAFASGSTERWFGLTVRQTNLDNYYYLTMRATNVVELRKLDNGAIRVLASAPLTVALNRPYRLRLEAVGAWIRGYVDGQLRVEAQDTLHTHGAPGVRMYRTAVDYDNVVITPNPQVTLFTNDFEEDIPFEWTSFFGNASYSKVIDGSRVLQQSNTTDAARLIFATDAGDQIVQVRAKATSFNGADRWFGLVARYADDYNFYYLTVRSSNQVSLRKQTGASFVALDTAPFTVTPNTWYTLRLEAVGDALRGYVNGQLLVEARDTTIGAGRYGVSMYKTAARFDDVRVLEP